MCRASGPISSARLQHGLERARGGRAHAGGEADGVVGGLEAGREHDAAP